MRVAPLRSAWLTVAWLCAAQAASVRAQAALEVIREPGAEGCPDGVELIARVRALHATADDQAVAAYAVTFGRDREAGAFTAVIRKQPAGGERVLSDRGESCAALAQAVAVTLALLLDPAAAQSAPAEEPPLRAEPSLAAAAPQAGPSERDRDREDASSGAASSPIGALTLAIGAAGIAGVVRPIAPAFLAEAGFDRRAWRIAVGALWVPPQTLDLAPGNVRTTLWVGTLRGCAALVPGALRIEACTGLHAGVLHGEARGFTRNEDADKLALAWPIELALSIVPEPVGFELTASAIVPLLRNEFAIDNVGTAYEPWPVGVSASARVVAAWEP